MLIIVNDPDQFLFLTQESRFFMKKHAHNEINIETSEAIVEQIVSEG